MSDEADIFDDQTGLFFILFGIDRSFEQDEEEIGRMINQFFKFNLNYCIGKD
jgi:hypothetical protein